MRRCAVLLGQGDKIGQVVALALAVDETGANYDSPNAGSFEHFPLRFGARRHRATKGVDERLWELRLRRCEDRGWKGSGMVLVEDRRTGLALGEDPEDCRTAGKYQRFSRVAEGLGHRRYGVTVLGEAIWGAFDLSDAGGADNGVHFGGGRGQAGGNCKVAGDRG